MNSDVIEYLVKFISDVLDIPAEGRSGIVVTSESGKNIKIIYEIEKFNKNILIYRGYDYSSNKINSELTLQIPNKYLGGSFSSNLQSNSTRVFRNFIKHSCKAANIVDSLVDHYNNEINVSELLELIKRITIPELLSDIYSEKANRLGDSISNPKIIDYGKIIRELLSWSNSKIEGKNINTGLIITDSINKLKDVSKKSTFEDYDIDIIAFDKQENLYDFKSIKSLLEVVDGINSFIIGEPQNNESIKISGILVSEKGLMDDLINNQKRGFNAPVFSLRENGLRIGRGNQLLMEYVKGRPRIRNYSNFHQLLKKELNISSDISSKLASLILEISHYGKGTTLVFGFKNDYENDVEKTHWISPKKIKFDVEKIFSDVLVSLSKTDGAVLINNDMEIIGFGSVLKATAARAKVSGGSRHKSMASFSHNKDVLGVVISEDGPITLIKNNKIILSL